MKKRLISLILMALMALSCALAEEADNVPLMAYYECFAVPLGENAIFEIPNEWGYQTSDAADVPPMTSPPTGRPPARATRWASSRSLLRERR